MADVNETSYSRTLSRDSSGPARDARYVFGFSLITFVVALRKVRARKAVIRSRLSFHRSVCARVASGDDLTLPQLARDDSIYTFLYGSPITCRE